MHAYTCSHAHTSVAQCWQALAATPCTLFQKQKLMKSSNTVGIDKPCSQPVSSVQHAQINGVTHKTDCQLCANKQCTASPPEATPDNMAPPRKCKQPHRSCQTCPAPTPFHPVPTPFRPLIRPACATPPTYENMQHDNCKTYVGQVPCMSINSRMTRTLNPKTCGCKPTRHGSHERSEVPGPHPEVASQVCSKCQAAGLLPQQGCCSASNNAVGLMRDVPHNMPGLTRKRHTHHTPRMFAG